MNATAKVLVIDDDADFRASVRSLLESEGYAVVEAESGKQGLEELARLKPDAILMDIMMECDCEGYGITHAIKHREEYREFSDTPILMVSSIQEAPDERFPGCSEVELIRPDRYLTKPLDIPSFLDTLKRALAGRPAETVPGR